MPKILISDSLSNIAKEVSENNNIVVDVITDLKPDNLIFCLFLTVSI